MIFKADCLYGMVGVIQCQRVNNGDAPFTISINQRNFEQGNIMTHLFLSDTTEILYLMRSALQLNTYEVALSGPERPREH